MRPLLAAIAAHGEDLVAGRAAAISVRRLHQQRLRVLITTSRDAGWLFAVEHLLRRGMPVHHRTPSVVEGRLVALLPFQAGGHEGVYVVAKSADAKFSDLELGLLAKVVDLIALTLNNELPGEPQPPGLPATTPASAAVLGDFHHRLPSAFGRLEGLPALKESRDALLAVLGRKNATADAIVTAIESDIALLAAALRLANRATGSGPPSIWSVAEAVDVLTLEGVAAMARRVMVFDFFERIPGWAVAPEQFRLHAVLTKRAAQRLARVIDHPHVDRLVVAALLHDVGKLVLMEAFPGYPHAVLASAATPEDRIRAERRELGFDHEMAGGVLLRRWQLPNGLAHLVAHHHSSEDDPDAALIGLSDALAHYAQGRPVEPSRLRAAARVVGLKPGQLRTVMYELLQGEQRRFGSFEASPLSRRQTEMLRELAKGKSYKEISEALGISPSTVRTHLYNVYKTLAVNNRAQAVLTATERSWL